MLFLPLEEDSLLFRLCLYYGALVLLLELLVPLLFQRRVRIEIPRLALRAPIILLSTREFQHRRLALQQQLMALQRALEETARWSPHKRRQPSLSAVKQRVAASPSPSPSPSSSPLASPTSSVKVTRPKSSHKTSGVKLRMEDMEEKDQGTGIRREGASRPLRQRPMAMSDTLATRTSRRGGFSFDEVSGEEEEEEKQHEQKQAVNTRPARRRESPTFSGRRPVRLVEEVEIVGYSCPSEAAARLEALIEARRRQKAATSTSHVPPPVTAPAPVLPPVPASVAPAVESEKSVVDQPFRAPKQTSPEVLSQSRKQHDHQVVEEDEETKDSEPSEVLTDFQAFCATFAIGGSAAALQAAAKRKHHEAFGSDVETNGDATGVAQEVGEKRKHPRVYEQSIEDSVPATSAAPQSAEKRTHYEAFGSDDEKEVDDIVADQQVLEKRNHDQAFGTAKEQKQEKTPRIVRRISFSDEVDALNASPSKEVPGESSVGKRTHKQAFAMHDDEDEDADWRDSLAFRPRHFG